MVQLNTEGIYSVERAVHSTLAHRFKSSPQQYYPLQFQLILKGQRNVPPSLAEDIHRLEINERENRADDENADEVNCQHRAQSNIDDHKCDWSLAAKNLLEMQSFITNQRREYVPQCVLKRADPTGKQLEAYEGGWYVSILKARHIVQHFVQERYLIQCLKLLLGDSLRVTAPTSVAAFNVNGIHS